MKNYTLGLDMGVASLGWACVSIEDQAIDSGVRIFPAGIDKFGTGKDTHPNQERRKARGARRRNSRKAKRRLLIRSILTDLDWIPNEENEIQAWEDLDVYELRHRGLSEKISLQELGRIILHLNQRRGFLSLRKSEVAAAEGDEKKQLEGILGDISRLEKDIQESGHQTLGNYLFHVYQEEGITVRIRGRHIRRQMLHHEFSLIWETQKKHHNELTDDLRYGSHGKQDDPISVTKPVKRNTDQSILAQFGIENLTFFQRRVYWPVDSIGHCELEPNELRAPTADRRFQEFRMLSELNNLRILDQSTPDKPNERELSDEEREVAITYLSNTQKPSLNGLKKKLTKLPNAPQIDQITFNLEADARENIGGLSTDLKLAKALGKKMWKSFDEDLKNSIVETLTLPEAGIKKVVQRTDPETWGLLEQFDSLKKEQIEALLHLSFPAGYCNLSIKALEGLLPHMRKGCLYQGRKGEDTNSARHLAGYPRRDEESNKAFELLPHLHSLTNPNDTAHYDKHFPHVNNPLILRSLHELRKVVNAVIRKHGKPTKIHLEMARDLKMSAKQRDDNARKNNEHKRAREIAANELEKYNIIPTRDAIALYRIWEEQNKVCIYSGDTIGIEQLLGGEVDIDHVFPRRTNDDSYMNKVVCFAEENRLKGDRLPTEWLANAPDKLEGLIQRAKSLPYQKRKRIIATEIPEDFAARDAVDTAYMTRVARHYLTLLVEEPHHILCTKGKHTALLRRQWQLNDLLRHDLIDLKNRDDHRHHALDAIVIALCDQGLIQKISHLINYENHWKEIKPDDGVKRRVYRLKTTTEGLSIPWKEFRLDVTSSINDIWVSHRPNRKVSGSLHEETNYGSTDEAGMLVRRKNLSALTPKEVSRIRDETVAKIVQQYIEREKRLFREDFGKKFNEEIQQVFAGRDAIDQTDIDSVNDQHLRESLNTKLKNKNPLYDAELGKIVMPSGNPIIKARLLIPNKAAVILRKEHPRELVIPGNTHHLVIFSLGDGKYHFEPVTLLEASRRKTERRAIVDKTPPNEHPDAEYMMYLCSGDSILADIDGKEELFIFATMASTTKQARFVSHLDARASSNKDKKMQRKLYTCKPNTFEKNFPHARKVDVLASGEIRYTD